MAMSERMLGHRKMALPCVNSSSRSGLDQLTQTNPRNLTNFLSIRYTENGGNKPKRTIFCIINCLQGFWGVLGKIVKVRAGSHRNTEAAVDARISHASPRTTMALGRANAMLGLAGLGLSGGLG